ncbi:divalent cation transporter [Rhodobacterales bacterium HKCCE3408]|nr:divalent cation transporter [Rhodobacterales bacterium HKCCE3408]
MWDPVTLLEAVLLAFGAGLAMPLGAALAMALPGTHPLGIPTVTAFGGGALLSAVALVLVPDGAAALPGWLAVGLLVLGGIVFLAVDRGLHRRGGRGSQLLAMLLDYLPEAAALGAILAADPGTATLLAGLIFIQNLPEGFAAFRDLEAAPDGRRRPRAVRVVMLFAALALVGPVFAAIGHVALSGAPEFLGAIMVFAAGGILYLIFQDLAPSAHAPNDPRPPLGAVAGFALGLAGHIMLG